jgi:hypothetical protein
MGFSWVPGQGACADRLTRMKDQTCKPIKPMGEAWFIGEERRIYTELEDDVSELPVQLLQTILGEIESGVHFFGHLDEWPEWLDYLLPHLIPRGQERIVWWLLEDLCSAFLQIDLDNRDPKLLRHRREDVLQTLGQTLMQESHWSNGSVVLGKILHPSNKNPAKIWGWVNVSGDLAASMVLCLRLIEPEDIKGWVQSIFSIDCPYWRAQVLTWYIGAKPLLDGEVHFPSQFDGWAPKIGWRRSHGIDGRHSQARVATSLISSANIAEFKTASETVLATADLDVWIEEILSVEALHSEVGSIIDRVKFL